MKPKKRIELFPLFAVLFSMLPVMVMAQDKPKHYVDNGKCKLCHNIPHKGQQYTLWRTNAHSNALDTLFEKKAQRFADELGVKTPPYESPECLKCHVTGYDVETRSAPKGLNMDDGVQCGSCHGPGSAHMDCHEKSSHTFANSAKTITTADDFHANDCTVCHRELTKETIPQFRHGQRIAHDSKQAWMHLHGQESSVDAAYCAQCHVEQEDCMTCHRIMKPDNHTLAWNQRLHGTHAEWDSQSCSVCHEEDSCMKCHQNTQPRSHRINFGTPRNNHCVQCHFEEVNNCAVCHESIDHRTAPRSPHDEDLNFPGDCIQCHPGGIPGAVPHRFNASVSCRTCHQ